MAAKKKEIKFATIEELLLDPLNPRLGRHNRGDEVAQERVRELVDKWSLEELAVSFLESGFWPQEAVVVVLETHYGAQRKIVVEGNRRIAAIMKLRDLADGTLRPSGEWAKILASAEPGQVDALCKDIPYIELASRKDVQAYLGFRHVSGIKEWRPAEKAEFIAALIEGEGLGYETVRRRIGSKADAVRRHYITFSMLRQMEQLEDIYLEKVEEKFSVLYLSLRTKGSQRYLAIDIHADPAKAREPVLSENFQKLVNYAKWLFGDRSSEPLFTDSRMVDRFGKILESPKGIEYLERTKRPVFEVAYRKAGGDETEVAEHLETAADELELALSTVHHHTASKRVAEAAQRLLTDVEALRKHFPTGGGTPRGSR